MSRPVTVGSRRNTTTQTQSPLEIVATHRRRSPLDEPDRRTRDAFRADVLTAIANLETDRQPSELAALTMSTSQIAFQRWCA